MKNQWLIIKQLDRQLKKWQTVGNQFPRPTVGWVKTIRTALNMTTTQLASRLGLKQGRISQLENAEVNDAVTLRSLRDAANTMGCDLVYAFIPKGNLTLEDIIRMRAEEIVTERISRVAHTMLLEAQSVDSNKLEEQKKELTQQLIKELNKSFWTNQNKISSKRRKKTK